MISQEPVLDEPVGLEDLLTEGKKTKAVNYSGFRVEALPHPNNPDKRLTLQYSYVPMHHIRPMAFWKEVLFGIPTRQFHPSIVHCITAMVSMAQIERYQFTGIWPYAKVKSKGLAYGPDHIFIGDVIRIFHKNQLSLTCILHVTDLVFNFEEFKSKPEERVTPEDVTSVYADVRGFEYTNDINISSHRVRVDPLEENHGLPAWVHEYGPWYHLYKPFEPVTISASGILSRLYEPAAVEKWFPGKDGPEMLNLGFYGGRQAKLSAMKLDQRVPDGKQFVICETRAEGLGIDSFNGQPVDALEDPYMPHLWRQVLAVIDKASGRDTGVDLNPTEETGYRKSAMATGTGTVQGGGDKDEEKRQATLDYAVGGIIHGIDVDSMDEHAARSTRTPEELIDPRLRYGYQGEVEGLVEGDGDDKGEDESVSDEVRESKRMKLDD